MDRKPFTTTIDSEIQNQFKSKCAINGTKMNDLLETFMKMYVDDKFELVLRLNETKTIVGK
jgi:hypothetical protein